MFQRFRRFLKPTRATSPASGVPHDQRCWPCRLQNTPCSLESGPTNGVCCLCQTFNMKCVGVGEDFPMTSNSKRAANAIRQWIAHPVNHDSNVPPLDLSHLCSGGIGETRESSKDTYQFFQPCDADRQSSAGLGKVWPPLTSIANHAFATCRLLLLRVPQDGALFPSHPIERDYRNVSVLTAALPVLSTQTSELLLKGPLDDASAMEQALEIILACVTQLEQSLEEARGAADVGHIMEDIKSILGVKKTTTLHDLDVVGADGADVDSGPRSDGGGSPGPSTFALAREDETTMRNLELSLPSTPSDPAGTRLRVSGDDGLAPPRTASQRTPPYSMPFRRLFLPRRRSAKSPSLPSHDSSPNKPSTSTVQRTLPESPGAPQSPYPDYLNETAGPQWDVALAMNSILEDIPAVPLALTTPLTQVLDVVSEIRDVVETMRDGKDACTLLLFRVLSFLHALVGGLKGMNIPDSAPMASSLFILKRNLMAIYADATRWSRLNLLGSYLHRDKIMTAISRHEDNLTDCLHTFQIVTSTRAFDPAEKVETIATPGPSVSARPLVTSESTAVSISTGGLEQVRLAVQACLEEIGLWGTAAPLGSRSLGTTALRTADDRYVSYLVGQIWELTAEVSRVLWGISVVTDKKMPFVRWETRWPQTGNPTQQLRQTIVATLELLVELPDTPHVELDSAMLSKKLYELMLNLRDLGLWDAALAVQIQVVKLCRLQGEMADVASSLTGLSACLWYLGRNEEALEPCQMAVSIFRQLQPKAFHLHLAHSLVIFSTHLWKLGRHEEMLQASEEASLYNFSIHLSEFGRHEEALKSNKEALEIYRHLVAKQPDIFHPYFALSLNNFSLCLSKFGRHQEALEASEEAVSLYRLLAADRPQVFGPDLARSLTSLSHCLSEFGRHEEVLESSEEALSIFRPLAADRPELFRPDLALSLSDLALCLSEFGRYQKALGAIEEAMGIYRLLIAYRPQVFHPDLARCLTNLSRCLSEFGRHEEALKSSEEAIGIYRLRAADRPEVFLPDLAHSLTNLSRCLLEFGRHEEALKSSEEAIGIYRLRAADRPEVFLPDLAHSLTNLSRCLSEFGRHEEALKSSEEAVGIYRLLAADRPEVFLPHLARSLTNLSRCLSEFGRHEEALKSSEEAVGIYRLLAADRPEVFLPHLARSLTNLSRRLSGLGRHDEALQSSEEALHIYRPLAADRPELFRPDLALSLDNLSLSLLDFGRHEEALEAIEVVMPRLSFA
ncbi:hypothetical protein BS47DRAFT_1400488 [Hydnum rufescens UP504]|uniref:Anaphase-promoting complex subunit 5 domain-containing protein n=1 Tax=Hydnum rufescens UP504 TaxID=1448309 RepID=A0A9P6AGE5_9AGAM|nr:hypothetical protein BS47DRAFT_1400488 [Hydnum rufescens UP504]